MYARPFAGERFERSFAASLWLSTADRGLLWCFTFLYAGPTMLAFHYEPVEGCMLSFRLRVFCYASGCWLAMKAHAPIYVSKQVWEACSSEVTQQAGPGATVWPGAAAVAVPPGGAQ